MLGARQPRWGVNSGIKRGLVQTVVGVKHGVSAPHPMRNSSGSAARAQICAAVGPNFC